MRYFPGLLFVGLLLFITLELNDKQCGDRAVAHPDPSGISLDISPDGILTTGKDEALASDLPADGLQSLERPGQSQNAVIRAATRDFHSRFRASCRCFLEIRPEIFSNTGAPLHELPGREDPAPFSSGG